MDVTSANSPPLARLAPPYDSLEPLSPSDDYLTQPPGPGSSIVWQLGFGSWSAAFDVIRRRSPGMALIVILPPKVEVDSAPQLLRVVEAGRPHSILPFHPEPHLDDLTAVLRREPEDLPVEFMDYLLWRGMNVDMDARRLIRKTVELSLELYTVTALARSLYLSRRALGRRFLKRGLPVPSHWLRSLWSNRGEQHRSTKPLGWGVCGVSARHLERGALIGPRSSRLSTVDGHEGDCPSRRCGRCRRP